MKITASLIYVIGLTSVSAARTNTAVDRSAPSSSRPTFEPLNLAILSQCRAFLAQNLKNTDASLFSRTRRVNDENLDVYPLQGLPVAKLDSSEMQKYHKKSLERGIRNLILAGDKSMLKCLFVMDDHLIELAWEVMNHLVHSLRSSRWSSSPWDRLMEIKSWKKDQVNLNQLEWTRAWMQLERRAIHFQWLHSLKYGSSLTFIMQQRLTRRAKNYISKNELLRSLDQELPNLKVGPDGWDEDSVTVSWNRLIKLLAQEVYPAMEMRGLVTAWLYSIYAAVDLVGRHLDDDNENGMLVKVLQEYSIQYSPSTGGKFFIAMAHAMLWKAFMLNHRSAFRLLVSSISSPYELLDVVYFTLNRRRMVAVEEEGEDRRSFIAELWNGICEVHKHDQGVQWSLLEEMVEHKMPAWVVGSLVEAMRTWTVVNGEWQERMQRVVHVARDVNPAVLSILEPPANEVGESSAIAGQSGQNGGLSVKERMKAWIRRVWHGLKRWFHEKTGKLKRT